VLLRHYQRIQVVVNDVNQAVSVSFSCVFWFLAIVILPALLVGCGQLSESGQIAGHHCKLGVGAERTSEYAADAPGQYRGGDYCDIIELDASNGNGRRRDVAGEACRPPC
jgi:hypothetical protein